MGEKTRQRLEAFLNDRQQISSGDARHVKALGRVAAYVSAGRVKSSSPDQRTFRSEINRLKGYDRKTQQKEISYFGARQNELSGRPPTKGSGGQTGMDFGGGGGAGGGGPAEESSDEEWYAEYGAWVEEVEQWRESYEGDLPELEELPF